MKLDAYDACSRTRCAATPYCRRQNAVEAAWAIVEPILGHVTPVYEYAPHTLGPAEAIVWRAISEDGTTRGVMRILVTDVGGTHAKALATVSAPGHPPGVSG